MTKRRKISFTSLFNQKGFGHVELFAAIVFVIIIGFIGDRVYEASHAATPSSTLFGVAASASTLSQYESEFGHLPVIRYYYTGLPASNAWTTGVPGLSKSAVIVSFKALPKTILSGADDATLTHFFDTAPTGHPIYYSYFHEPEDNIAHGQFTLADYKAAWTHIVALADAAHNSDLHSTLILQSYDLSPSSHRDWKDYMAPNGVISTLGWDAYPQGVGCGCGPAPLTPPSTFMAPAVAASKAANMPFGFAEFGVAGTKTVLPGRPAWLTSIGSYLTANGALFGTYFDTSGPKPSQQLTDAASIAAWKKVIATSDSSVAPPHPPSSLPTVSITSPGNDAKVKGVITIGVKASSNVSRVNIVWDSSKLIRNASTKGPYGWGSRWGTTKASNGKHTITVTVYNAAGESKSSTITVKIDN